MTLMLDTNAYTAYMRDDPSVAERVEASTRLLLPAAAVGELIYGFRYGTRCCVARPGPRLVAG